MRNFLVLLAGVLLWGQMKGQGVSSDTTIVLNQVNIIDGEDPAVVLWRTIKKEYQSYRERTPENITFYSRQISDSIQTDFEQLSIVHFNENAPFQSVEAFKEYTPQRADFGNEVSIGFQLDLSPETDFNDRQPSGTFSSFPLAAYSYSDWSPLERSEFTPYHPRAVAGWLLQGGMSVYKADIVRSIWFAGEEYVTLRFAPKPGREGWSGTLKVNAATKRVLSLQAEYKGVSVEQTFSTSNWFYVTKLAMEIEEEELFYEQTSQGVNTPSKQSAKKNPMMVAYIPDQPEVKEDFWSAYRPKSEALDTWTKKQDSLIRYLNSDQYLDSADQVYNKFHWYEPLVSGVGYRKRSKGTNFYLSPLISQWNTVGVGGVRWMPMVMYSKRFSNYQSISTVANINYGFLNQDLKGSFSTTYTYAPLHNGSVRFSAGDEYKQITQSVDLAGVFARSNFVRKTFVEGAHRYEWFNGFYTESSLEYSKRESIEGLQFAEWTNTIFGQRNEPAPFPTYTVAQLGLEILIRPYQRYYLKGRQKIVLSSKWPDFRIILKQGIPKIFGSDVSYTKYEFLVDDMLRLGALGESFYRFSSGGFLNDPSSVRFIEHKWFRGGDNFLFTHPLYTFQALPETFSSPGVYITGSAIHHFDGFILNKLPFIRRLKLGSAVGCSMLAVPSENIAHFESYLGLERKVKLWNTPTRFGVYYMLQSKLAQPGFQWKIGIDIKDTFGDRWNF